MRRTPARRTPELSETPAPVQAAPPAAKKAPQEMTREELLAKVAELEARTERFIRVKQTDTQYYANLLRITYHGKMISVNCKPAYKFNLVNFGAEPSIEHCAMLALDDAQRGLVMDWIGSHAKDGELPPLLDQDWMSAATIIMIMHCLGIQASRNGYLKPRSLGHRKTLYEYTLELMKTNPATINNLTAIDGIILSICRGHCFNRILLKNYATMLKQFVLSLERHCAAKLTAEDSDEEAEETEEEASEEQ